MTGEWWTVRAVRVVIEGARVSVSAVATIPGAILADAFDLIDAFHDAIDAFERAEEEAEGFYQDQIEPLPVATWPASTATPLEIALRDAAAFSCVAAPDDHAGPHGSSYAARVA